MTRLYRSTDSERDVRAWCRDRLAAFPAADLRMIDTSLGPTHVAELGRGDDVCIYLPGTNGNAATSRPLLEALAAHVRVMCPDLPGQPGLSTGCRPQDEVSDHAAWTADLVEHVRRTHTGRIVLAGHSRGAAVALASDPGRVHGLVLASPAGLCAVRVTAAVLRTTLPWLLRPTPERAARLVDLMSGGGPVAQRDGLEEWFELIARSTRTSGAPGPLPTRVTERWATKPVVVLAGQRDVFFPPERLSAPVRDQLAAHLQVVPGSGHLLVDERPDQLVEGVLRVFRGALPETRR